MYDYRSLIVMLNLRSFCRPLAVEDSVRIWCNDLLKEILSKACEMPSTDTLKNKTKRKRLTANTMDVAFDDLFIERRSKTDGTS